MKAKRRNRIWAFSDEVYKVNFVLWYCTENYFLNGLVGFWPHDPPFDKKGVAGSCVPGTRNGGFFVHVFVNTENTDVRTPVGLAVLVHETLHAALYTFEHIGEENVKAGTETLTYYQEYIFRECLKRMWGKRT